MSEGTQRRLAAILAADVVGYSRLMSEDEASTLDALRHLRREVFAPAVTKHNGQLVKSMGDGWLVEFASIADGVSCAIDVQKALEGHELIKLRIGLHVGDVTFEDEDIYGDGVNVAARLQELADPGAIVISAAARSGIDGKLSAGFEDLGALVLKNITQPVTAFGWGTTGVRQTASAPPLPDKPSIAVLPFGNLSGDPEQEYFADGMAEDLITDLSKISNLHVAARNSSFSFKGQMRDIKEIAEILGVSFVLEGSVRKMGQRLRINAQLIKAADGGHLWAERYDGAMDEIFEFQDRIRSEIIAALELQLTAFDNERSQQRRTTSVEAYDLFLKGRSSYFQYTPDSHAAAREYLAQAIEIDPQFAEAHSNFSYSVLTSRQFMWYEQGDELERALALAEKGAELDPESALAWTRLAWATGWAGNFDKAVEYYEQALKLEPENAEVYAYYGETLNFTDKVEKSVELLSKALEIEKLSPPSWDFMLGHAFYELGRNEEAIPGILRCIERVPMFPPARLYLACTYVELGRLAEAEEQVRVLLDLDPRYTVAAVDERYKYADETNHARFLGNLRRAGLPEG